MVLSEPVSEALLPVYNQLSTLKRCLLEVKGSGGVNSARELYPYSMKVRKPPLQCPKTKKKVDNVAAQFHRQHANRWEVRD